MATFGVITEKNPDGFKFMVETNKRLSTNDLVKNPFHGFAKLFIRKKDYLTIVKMNPIYPNFGLIIGFFTSCLIFFFKGLAWTNWYIIPAIFLFASFLWSKYFFFAVLKLGIRKAGYKQKVELLSSKDLIEALVDLSWVKKK